MILVILTALMAVCGAAKLERSYLPPITAKTAGGSPGALQAPFDGTNQGLSGLPSGSYTNDVQGVVVDAVNPGTRTSGLEPTGLGGPRTSYGSTDSKVGDAAFTGFGSSGGISTRIAPGFESAVTSDDSNTDKTRVSNLKFVTDVGLEKYSYGFDTDNGISVGENGVASGGVQAQGGYSYKGNDGKTYSVTYTADKGGYKPQGQHLPTSPPIPEEIIKSLEKNAKEEAAGLVDDGSYDAQKYNDESVYSSNSASNNNVKQTIGGGDATASGSIVSKGNEAYRPTSGGLTGTYKPSLFSNQAEQGQVAQGFVQVSQNKQSSYDLNKDQSEAQSSLNNNFGNKVQFEAKPQFSPQGTTASLLQTTEKNFVAKGIKPKQTTSVPTGQSFSHAHASTGDSNASKYNLPGSSSVNSAYSAATATGFGSASAFASTGSDSGLKNDNQHFLNNFRSDSLASSSFPASASASGYSSFGSLSQKGSGSQHAHTENSHHSTDHSTFGQSNESGFGSESLPQVNAVGSKGKVTYGSSALGAESLTSASDVNAPSPSPNFPSSATASASVLDNSGAQFAQNTNSFPSRLGETQNSQFTSSEDSFVKPEGSYSIGINSQSEIPSGNSATGNEYRPPVNIIESPGKPTSHVKPQGTAQHSSSVGSSGNFHQFGHENLGELSNAFTRPSTSGSSSFGASSHQTGFQSHSFTSKPGQYSQINNAFPSSVGQAQVDSTNYQSSSVQPTQSAVGLSSPTPVSLQSQPEFPNRIGSGQNKPQNTHTGPIDAAFASTTQQPTLGQQQGSDDSYYYKQPSKPFITPATGSASSNSQFINNRYPDFPISSLTQQGSKYSNTPSTSGQYQSTTSTSYNGIVPSNQFISQSSQSSSKPTSLSSQQTFTQFGGSGSQFGQNQRPIVQSQSQFAQSSTGQNSVNLQIPTQQYQGTVYEYNKPAETLPTTEKSSSLSGQVTTTSSQANPSQLSTGSKFGSQKGSSQFGTQSKPFGSTNTDSSVQATQTVQSSSTISQKPFGGSTTGSSYQQSQYGTAAQFVQKPQSNLGADSSANTDQKPFGQISSGVYQTGSSYQQSQFGSQESLIGTQFGQKPQTSTGSAFSINTVSKGQSGQTSQFGQKPFSSSQTAGSIQQKPQVGSSTDSQLPQGVGSTTGIQYQNQFGQALQTGQNLFGASPTGSKYQQTQFGSTEASYAQKPQTSQGSSFTSTTGSKVQPTGSNFQQFGSLTGSQSSQGVGSTSITTTQNRFGQKPFGASQIGSKYQQTQFGFTGSSFTQKPQTSQGLSLTSTSGSKVQTTGSKFQQSGFLTGSQSSQGVGSTSITTSQNQFGQGLQSGQKPFGAPQTGSKYQQTQFGSTGSSYVQKPQTSQESSFTSTTGSKVQTTGSKFQQSGSITGSQSSQGVGSTSVTTSKNQFGQGLQSGQKPFGASQTGSKYQQTQFGSTGTSYIQKPQTSQESSFTSTTGSKVQPTGSNFQQFGSLTGSQSTSITTSQNQFGQKPIGASQAGSKYQQTQFGYTGSSFAQKPQTSQGSSFTSTTGSKVQPTGSNFQQFGSLTGSQSSQGVGLTSITTSQNQFGQKPFGASQAGSKYQQTQFGSTGSSFAQKPQTSQGSSFTSTTGSKVQPTGSNFQQFGSLTGSQSSQGVGSTSITTSQNQFGQGLQSGQKPFGASQTGSKYQQTQFGSTGSSYVQKPQTSQESSFTSTTGSKVQTTGAKFQQSGSITGSQSSQGVESTSVTTSQNQFGQGLQSGQKPFGASQTGSKYQQTQFGSTGSSYVQKPQSFQGSSFTSTTGSKVQPTVSNFQQFGSLTGSQSSQGVGLTSITTSQNQFGQGLQSGQKPFGASQTGSKYQQTQFGSTGSSFVQKPQTSQESSFTSTTGSKVQTTGSKFQQSGSITGSQSSQGVGSTSITTSQNQFGQGLQSGQKPFGAPQTGSKYQQTQFGSTGSSYVQKPQTSQGPSFTSTTASTVQTTGSNFQQSGSLTGLQSSQGLTSSTSSQTQLGQALQSGQKPLSTSQSTSTYQQSQFGSAYGQKPQSSLGTSSSSNQGPRDQSAQTTQLGQKPFGSSQISGSNIQQTQFASSSGSSPTQSLGSTVATATASQFGQASLYGKKPLGSLSSTTGSASSFQFGSSGSQNSQTTGSSIGSYSQSSQTSTQAKKPFESLSLQFGSATGQFGQKPAAQASAFASSIGSNTVPFNSQTQQPFSNKQTNQVSKYQQTSQFGTQGQVASTEFQAQKPFVSSLPQSNYQQSQYSQFSGQLSTPSRFGQGTQSSVGILPAGEASFGTEPQKLFGSQPTQTTFQQAQGQKPFGSTQGSAFQIGQSSLPSDQKTQPTQSSIQTTSFSNQFAQNFGSEHSSDGYNYQKPEPAFNIGSQFEGPSSVSPQDQKPDTSFNSQVSISQQQFGSQPEKPFGSSTVGSTPFSVQPTKATEFELVSQTSRPQTAGVSTIQYGVQPTKPTLSFSGQPFQTASTQGSSFESQFGVQPTQSVVITSQKPSQSQFSAETLSPSGFSSTQAPNVPSRLGYNVNVNSIPAPQATIVPVPGYEIVESQPSFAGQGEEFGGPRDPPRFDDKTGYHY